MNRRTLHRKRHIDIVTQLTRSLMNRRRRQMHNQILRHMISLRHRITNANINIQYRLNTNRADNHNLDIQHSQAPAIIRQYNIRTLNLRGKRFSMTSQIQHQLRQNNSAIKSLKPLATPHNPIQTKLMQPNVQNNNQRPLNRILNYSQPIQAIRLHGQHIKRTCSQISHNRHQIIPIHSLIIRSLNNRIQDRRRIISTLRIMNRDSHTTRRQSISQQYHVTTDHNLHRFITHRHLIKSKRYSLIISRV